MSNDLIYRDELLSVIDQERRILIERKMIGAEHVVVHHARRFIEDAPAVDAVAVTRCEHCAYFMEYTEEYKRSVENADGDCYIRVMNSDDKQFCARKYSDFCSDAKPKEC